MHGSSWTDKPNSDRNQRSNATAHTNGRLEERIDKCGKSVICIYPPPDPGSHLLL